MACTMFPPSAFFQMLARRSFHTYSLFRTFRNSQSHVRLGICISFGTDFGNGISLRICRARLAFANPRQLQHRHYIRLSLKGKVLNVTVCSVLLYGCETWVVWYIYILIVWGFQYHSITGTPFGLKGQTFISSR